MGPLLEALMPLGVEAWSSRGNGCAPIVVRGGGVKGGETRVIGWQSSQYISAILMAGLGAERPVILSVEGEPVSRPYIDATIKTIQLFGGDVAREGYTWFEVRPKPLRGVVFRVPGDFGSDSFLVAAAYVTGGEVVLRGLDTALPQADAAILELAEAMGADIKREGEAVRVRGTGVRRGVEASLRDSPDLLPVVAVMAAATPERSVIRDVAHARLKESDRIRNISAELGRLGVKVKQLPDGLEVVGPDRLEGGVAVESHDDHRLFMAFTVLGLSCSRGLRVAGVESADVSYPTFLGDLSRLGAYVRTYSG